MLVTLFGITISPVALEEQAKRFVFVLSLYTSQPSTKPLILRAPQGEPGAEPLYTIFSTPLKAGLAMLVTLLGMVILIKPVQPEKARLPMLVTPFGISMLVRLKQLKKAPSPMLVTLFGIVIEVNFEQQ